MNVAPQGGAISFGDGAVRQLRYGNASRGWYYKTTYNLNIGIACTTSWFDGVDPAPGVAKVCEVYQDSAAPSPPPIGNPVVLENAKTAADGVSSHWRIDGATHAFDGEILGYASATSVNRGGSIKFYVSVANPSADPGYTIDVYRTGWYGGVGGRKVMPTIAGTSVKRNDCTVAPVVAMVECDWAAGGGVVDVPIPTAADPTVAMSGVYLAKLTTNNTKKSSYIVFVVRDDARRADFMFQSSFTTYAAYNDYGGYSYYQSPTNVWGSQSRAVSLNRPFNPRSSYGAGQYFSWEFHTVRFLEREGYNVLYSTNIDTHVAGATRLPQFRAFLSVGHDEYWTRSMYDAVEGARNAGVNMAFLGANTAYWQVRLEPDAQGAANRRMVGYRYWVSDDPLIGTASATTLWRNLGRAEAGLVGVQYDYDPVDGDIVVSNCPGWICLGTGVSAGTRLAGLLGYEVDQTAGIPVGANNFTVMGVSPYIANVSDANGTQTQVLRNANMSFYTHNSGAQVFATGSMQWSWGLDDFQAYPGYPQRLNPGAQAMTRNILNRYLTVPTR